MKYSGLRSSFIALFIGVAAVLGVARAFAEDAAPKNAEPVELNGDSIEYKAEEGKFVASGHVYLKQNGAVLFCDKLEFYRDKKEAHAEGNVVLDSDQGKIWAEKAFYNFNTKKGEFTNARLLADPIYGRARSIVKVRDNYYVINSGYLTTSDFDDPEYRVRSKTIDVYPGDKAIARDNVLYFGSVPVMYWPKYTQDLSGKRPLFSLTPGYKKEFGGFALMSYHTKLTDRIDTTYHVDYRELKGLAWGVDAGYDANPYGQGLLRTYYMNEQTTDAHRGWEQNTQPVIEHQRYRVELRHKWDIDPATTFIGQYYKQTDAAFTQKYFPGEYYADQSPPTYALLTHVTPATTSYVRTDMRINRFESTVERLPEVGFSLSNQKIADTGLYFKSTNTATDLLKQDPSPSDNQNRTQRIDSDNELSRPFKAGFLEFRPFVGTEETYYSRTLYRPNDDSVRTVFRTGSDVSTKFYKIYDVNYNKYGVEINRLRHVITPTIGYLYQHEPTLTSDKLFQYDIIDSRDRIDKFSLGFENKLQTKRGGQSVDLLRALLTTDFRLKDNPTPGSFGDVTLKTDLVPNKYVSFFSDATYSSDYHYLSTANGDVYINSQKNWTLDLGRRYTHGQDDLLRAQWEYKFNPKWRTYVYESWNAQNGKSQEQRYAFIRDLHSWEVEFAFSDKNKKVLETNGGTELWLIFRLKAFPSIATGRGTMFSRTQPGAQPLVTTKTAAVNATVNKKE
ncbi:MAG: LPS assembly protein LptD [Candidatus Omnitrophica bacterium]|nr:LPS assembly protein LptD [Candidatus Omnitrophota bacterium]